MSWLDDFNRGNWLASATLFPLGPPDIPTNSPDMLQFLFHALSQAAIDQTGLPGLESLFQRQPIAQPGQGLPATQQQQQIPQISGLQVSPLQGQGQQAGTLTALAAQYGFPNPDLAASIMMAESSGRADAQSYNNDGSIDRGIWQINNRWHPEVSDACAYDPACATQAAFAISNGGTNFEDWVAYNTGRNQQFLGQNNPVIGGRNAQGQSYVQGATDRIPIPFSEGYFGNETEYFHETPGEYGNDYGMPQGTELVTPFGGTISTEDDGRRNWGKRVFVHMPNGWTMAIGHMHAFYVQDGQQVAPGQVLGESGGALSDPSSGVSTGPHIEFQLIDPSGQYVDPHPYLQQIFAGTDFSTFANGTFVGVNQVQPSPEPARYRTPDGVTILENTPEDRWYKMADSVWTSVYGMHAPSWAADTIREAGIQNTDQLHNFMLSLPSHIPGLNLGQYENLQKAAQSSASKYLGVPVPDALLQQFAGAGITSPNLIDLWFESHSSSDIPKGEYQQIWAQANSWTQALSGDYPHPDSVAQIWQNSGGVVPRPTGPANPLIPVSMNPWDRQPTPFSH